VNIIWYYGNAEDIIDPAVRLGWEYAEDDHLDHSGIIDWDSVLSEATEYLNKKGYKIEYD
jgi:hypothetical protein